MPKLLSSDQPRQTRVVRADVRRTVSWRVGEIHRLINEGSYPNCETLARRIEVSAKTIRRDISFMRDQKGMPIEYDEVRHGYHYTAPVSEFPALQLSKGELVALFIARKALEPLRGTKLERLLAESVQKIAAACPEHVSFDWQDLDAALSVKAAGVVPADAQLFAHLLDAVMNRQEVVFDYHKLKGSGKEQRRVQPYHVGQINHGWYLIGHDLERGEIRTFAMQRLSALLVQRARFSRPPDFRAQDYLSSGFGVWSYGPEAGNFEVRIRFTDWAARVVSERQWHHSQSILQKKADGSEIEFRAQLAGLEEITRWVLSWGSKAQVLGPEELKQRVDAEIQLMIKPKA